MFILGIIVGMIIDLTAFIVFLYLKPRTEKYIKVVEDKFKPDPEGEVFMDTEEDEEIKKFINNLPNE